MERGALSAEPNSSRSAQHAAQHRGRRGDPVCQGVQSYRKRLAKVSLAPMCLEGKGNKESANSLSRCCVWSSTHQLFVALCSCLSVSLLCCLAGCSRSSSPLFPAPMPRRYSDRVGDCAVVCSLRRGSSGATTACEHSIMAFAMSEHASCNCRRRRRRRRMDVPESLLYSKEPTNTRIYHLGVVVFFRGW